MTCPDFLTILLTVAGNDRPETPKEMGKMAAEVKETQGPRPDRAVVMLTADEKRAVRVLAAARDTSESDLLRAHLDLTSIMADFDRLRPAIADVA